MNRYEMSCLLRQNTIQQDQIRHPNWLKNKQYKTDKQKEIRFLGNSKPTFTLINLTTRQKTRGKMAMKNW